MLIPEITFSRTFEAIILAMKESRFEFYLTGSRHFGNYREDSDWDFFAEDSKDIKTFLEGNGFQKVIQEYKDENTTVVYMFWGGTMNKSIHVQLQHLVSIKKAAQELCTVPTNKSERNDFWNKLYKTVKVNW